MSSWAILKTLAVLVLYVIVTGAFSIPANQEQGGDKPSESLVAEASCDSSEMVPRSSTSQYPELPATTVIPGTTFPSALITSSNATRLPGDPQEIKIWVKLRNPEGQEIECDVFATIIFDAPYQGIRNQHPCPLIRLLPKQGKETYWWVRIEAEQLQWPIKAITVQPMAFWPG